MKAILLPLLFLFIFFSCHKSERDKDVELESTNDIVNLITWENDVFAQLHFACDSLSAINKMQSTCATISVSGSVYPKTVTINFGATNCLGTDGHNRRGIITAVFSGKYRDSLTTISLSSNNFYVRDNKVDVSTTIVNKGRRANGNYWFTVSSTDTITLTNNKLVTYTGSFTRDWVSAISTSGNFVDDFYLMNGTALGKGSRGNNFTLKITDPLSATPNCGWITAGSIELIQESLNSRYINFGNGSCDNKAEVYLNQNGYEITLP